MVTSEKRTGVIFLVVLADRSVQDTGIRARKKTESRRIFFMVAKDSISKLVFFLFRPKLRHGEGASAT